MRYLIIISTILLGACGRFHLVEGIWYYPEELTPHIEEYLTQREHYLGNESFKYVITFGFYELPDGILGRCKTEASSKFNDVHVTKVIMIDREGWEGLDYLDREELIFHELGHCDLDKKHTEHLSIMYPYHIGYHYETDREAMIGELFLN
jgi:hypothetical protein